MRSTFPSRTRWRRTSSCPGSASGQVIIVESRPTGFKWKNGGRPFFQNGDRELDGTRRAGDGGAEGEAVSGVASNPAWPAAVSVFASPLRVSWGGQHGMRGWPARRQCGDSFGGDQRAARDSRGEARGLDAVGRAGRAERCGEEYRSGALLIGASPTPAQAIGRAVQRHRGVERGARWLFWKGGEVDRARLILTADPGVKAVSELSIHRAGPTDATTIKYTLNGKPRRPIFTSPLGTPLSIGWSNPQARTIWQSYRCPSR